MLPADGSVPPLVRCPSGSGGMLQDCHGPKLNELRSHCTRRTFQAEVPQIIAISLATGIRLPAHDITPCRTWQNRQTRRKKKRQHK